MGYWSERAPKSSLRHILGHHDEVEPLSGFRDVNEFWVTSYEDPLWTTTAPTGALCEPLVSSWQLRHVARWGVEVKAGARVYEINSPEDWESLVQQYPLRRRRRPSSRWELPGPDQEGVGLLETLEGQRAMSKDVRWFVEPDWEEVARDWDAVHLTWAGFLTTEGLVIDLGDDTMAMLRGWKAERTLWLNPVLSNPVPLPPPPLVITTPEDVGVDVTTDVERREEDLKWLLGRLGR